MRGQEYTFLCLLAQNCVCGDVSVMLLLFLLLLLILLADVLALLVLYIICTIYLITGPDS